MANVEGDSVSEVFIGLRALSTNDPIAFLNQGKLVLLDHCMICESKEGFIEISHSYYRI